MPRSRSLVGLLGPVVALIVIPPAVAQKDPPPKPVAAPPVIRAVRPVLRPAIVVAQPVPGFPGFFGTPAAPGLSNGSAPAMSDEEALKQAGLSPTDGPQLVGYLKQRTLPDADQGKIQGLIKQFSADGFDVRLKASEELELYGPAAISPLKAAEKDSDPEVAYLASRTLKRLEQVPHAAAAAAAVRAVVKLKPPGAAEALLGFLPMADSETLAGDIRGALVAVAAPDGKPEPALVAALKDPSAVRRGAAYIALIEGGPATERIRIKESFPQVTGAVRKETDPDAKFRGLWSLTLTTRDKEYLPDLIAMIPQLPRGRIWQLEDLLLQLAGKHPEGGRFGRTADSLAKAKDAWAGWWAKKGSAVDLAKIEYRPRIRGFTDLVEADQRGFGMGRVACLGPDLKEKWQITGLRNASDARVLPSGHVLVVETSYSSVTERDATGTVLKTRNVNQPLSARPLPNGGLLIVCRQLVYEYGKDGNQVWVYQRPNTADILAGRRLPGGDTVFLTIAQQGPNLFRLDGKGKLVGTGVTVGRAQNIGIATGMDVIGEDRILVCEPNQVAEYDLKTGKVGWKYSINMPTSVQRLPSGNTLIACLNQNRAFEVDPDGEVVWEYRAKDGLHVSRAYRR